MRFSIAELEGFFLDTTARQHFRNLCTSIARLRVARHTLEFFVVTSVALHLGLWLWVQGVGLGLQNGRESQEMDASAAAAAVEISMISTMDYEVDEVFDPRSEISTRKRKKKPGQEARVSQLLQRLQAMNLGSKIPLAATANSELNPHLLQRALSLDMGSSPGGGGQLTPAQREQWDELQRRIQDQAKAKASASADVQKLRSFLVAQKSLFQRCFSQARRADPQLAGSLKTVVSVHPNGVLKSGQFEFSTRSPGSDPLTQCLGQELRALSFPIMSEPTTVQFQMLFAG